MEHGKILSQAINTVPIEHLVVLCSFGVRQSQGKARVRAWCYLQTAVGGQMPIIILQLWLPLLGCQLVTHS